MELLSSSKVAFAVKALDYVQTQQISGVNNENPEEIQKKWILTDFDIDRLLGEGRFGKVYKAKEKRTQFVIALKFLFRRKVENLNMLEYVQREVEFQTHLRHPNILILYGYFYDDIRIYLVLEYAQKGGLDKELKKQPNKRFNAQRTATYIAQLADALRYCHKKSVIHCDVKLENLLLGENGELKLADFGSCVRSPSSQRNTLYNLDYLPPEMVSNKMYTHTVDFWSVGVVCYKCLVGMLPFSARTKNKTYLNIKKLRYIIPSFISEDAKDLISKLIVIDPEKRLDMNGVLAHTWIVKNRIIN